MCVCFLGFLGVKKPQVAGLLKQTQLVKLLYGKNGRGQEEGNPEREEQCVLDMSVKNMKGVNFSILPQHVFVGLSKAFYSSLPF